MRREADFFLQNYLKNESPPFNVLIVQGARQVGKTFLVESALKSRPHTAINLEKQPEVKLAIDSSNNFAELQKRLFEYTGFKPDIGHILYIDEAQESNQLGRFIRQFKEDWKQTKVILSGSSMNRLFREEQRVPVGRMEYLTVYPFSFREYLRILEREELLDNLQDEIKDNKSTESLHQTLLNHYDRYLHVGGMPEAVKASASGDGYLRIHEMILASQRDDFIRKEPVDDHLFLDAFRALAHHVGDISHYAHVPTTQYKAKNVIELLKKWFIVIEVPQLGSAPSQKFSPKRYLYDVGILRSYRELAIPKISLTKSLSEIERTPLGGLIENAVLLPLLSRTSGMMPISGWKKDKKHPIEVDFILKLSPEVIIPMEIKASLNVQTKHLKNLTCYAERHKPQTAMLVNLDRYNKIRTEAGTEYVNVPAYGVDEFLKIKTVVPQ